MFDIENPNISKCKRENCNYICQINGVGDGNFKYKKLICRLSLYKRFSECPIWNRELMEKLSHRCVLKPIKTVPKFIYDFPYLINTDTDEKIKVCFEKDRDMEQVLRRLNNK